MINYKLHNTDNHLAIEPDKDVLDALYKNKKNHNCKFQIYDGIITTKDLSLIHLGYATYTVPDQSGEIVKHKSLDDIQADYNMIFDCLVADCEGFLEIFFDENPNFINQLNTLIIEKDESNRCNYDKLDELFKKKKMDLYN